jgi:hypothetical protein
MNERPPQRYEAWRRAIDFFGNQLNTTAAIIPIKVRTSPPISIGTRLLPENGLADSCARSV